MIESSTSQGSYTLLTGATGMVGGHLLVDLLRSQIPVAVLSRAQGDRSAEARIDAVLRQKEQLTGQQLLRPVVLEGDLRKSGLGLSPVQEAWVAANCCRILHSAANLSFRPAAKHRDNEPFLTNVSGTENLIELCLRAGIREVHHISTAYTCGLRSGIVREADCDLGQGFANDYERSKILAENLLRAERGIDSLTIYRPSIVIDLDAPASPDRTIQHAYLMYQQIRQQVGGPASGEWYQSLGISGSERKNLVHADWVSRIVVQILRRRSLHGHTYHLTSETGTPFSVLAQAFDEAFCQQAQKSPSRTSVKPTPQALALMNQIVKEFSATFSPYFRDDPTFSRAQLEQSLFMTGEAPCPEVGVEELRRVALQDAPAKPGSTKQEEPSKTAVAELRSRQSFLPAESQKLSPFGLVLHGPGGGEWTIAGSREGRETGFTIHAGIAMNVSDSVYATASLFESLVNREISLEAALEQGAVLFIHDSSRNGLAGLTTLMQSLLTMLRKATLSSQSRRGIEVGHVD